MVLITLKKSGQMLVLGMNRPAEGPSLAQDQGFKVGQLLSEGPVLSSEDPAMFSRRFPHRKRDTSTAVKPGMASAS